MFDSISKLLSRSPRVVISCREHAPVAIGSENQVQLDVVWSEDSGPRTKAPCNTLGTSKLRKIAHTMNDTLDRDLGEQPISAVMEALDLKPHDVVAASTVQMTHKMVTRAMKGRRLTANVKCKVRDALNLAGGTAHRMSDLFNY